jgi:lambda repressor-like predicted transcriptional regulator
MTTPEVPTTAAVGSPLDGGVRPLVWMPVLGHPLAIRAVLLDRRQALANHGQSLERLAERGGLSLDEAAAIALRRKWAPMKAEDALAALKGCAERYVPAA